MKLLVYTCVTNGYDIVFTPIINSPGIDFKIITDDTSLKVNGWQIEGVRKKILDPSLANRYYKILAHKIFPEYDYSLYVDGNIRIVSDINLLFKDFIDKQCDIGLFEHFARNSIQEEVETCLSLKKVQSGDTLLRELAFYFEKGFPDNAGLTENNIILRKHNSQNLNDALELWWDLVSSFSGRDQISLPFVRWKSSLNEVIYPFNAKTENPFFAIYPHNKPGLMNKLRLYAIGKRFDNHLCYFLYSLISLKRKVNKVFNKSFSDC